MEYAAGVIALALIYGMVAVADNLPIGFSGQFTIAQGAFFGVGAYTYALTTAQGVPISIALLLACLIGGTAGAAVSYTGRGLRGDYFLIVTFAFQIIVVRIALNWRERTGGSGGIFGIEPFAVFGYSPLTYIDWLWVLVPIFVLFWLVYTAIAASTLGLIWKAIREDDAAALSLGRSIVAYKMLAYGLGAAGAAFAGGIYAGFITFINPGLFTFHFSIFILSVLIVGGMASPLGPVIGVSVLIALPEALRFVPSLSDDVRSRLLQMIYALALLVFIALRPQGLVPERPGRWSFAAWRWRRGGAQRHAEGGDGGRRAAEAGEGG